MVLYCGWGYLRSLQLVFPKSFWLEHGELEKHMLDKSFKPIVIVSKKRPTDAALATTWGCSCKTSPPQIPLWGCRSALPQAWRVVSCLSPGASRF